jgi:hypothetical protein
MFCDEREIGSENRSGRVLKLNLWGLDMVGLSMEGGIYPERPISYVKIGMILIGSKRIQEDPGIFSLRFTRRDTGSLCL